MWTLLTLTGCLLLTLAAVALVVKSLLGGVVSSTREMSVILVEALQSVVKPMVNPDPIRQTELPEQEGMFADKAPPWETDWDGSPKTD